VPAQAMLKMATLAAIMALCFAAPGLGQTPAHRAAHAVLQNQPTAAAMRADEFSSELAAKAHCPGGTVVWVNLSGGKIYHLGGDRLYGKTRHGAFMCQTDAGRWGFHQAAGPAAKR
jgi:hypothetical protein